MKGILLAGGSGTRLYPITKCLSKHLIPIYDKPMIYYPLSILLQLGIKEILIISTKEDLPAYKDLFSNGHHLGIHIEYAVQEKPKGIADAFRVGRDFIDGQPVTLILGDNLFYGENLIETLSKGYEHKEGATIFGYPVENPSRFGVVEYSQGKVLSIEEKPLSPKSNMAVPGLYFYDETVVEKAYAIKPSKRGELEITAINQLYLDENQLFIELMSEGKMVDYPVQWLDTGTFNALLQASNFVRDRYEKEGKIMGHIELIAYKQGFITIRELQELIEGMPDTAYRNILKIEI